MNRLPLSRAGRIVAGFSFVFAITIAACGGSDDSGLDGDGFVTGCYSTCRDDGGNEADCLASCQQTAGEGGSTSAGGSTAQGGMPGVGGSMPAGNGGMGGSGQAGSGQGGSGQAGSGQAGSGQGGSSSGCSNCPTSPVGAASCCTPADKCGYDLGQFGIPGCQEANAPGNVDQNCPDGFVPSQNITLEGCCRYDGICGFEDPGLGLGCMDPTSFGIQPESC